MPYLELWFITFWYICTLASSVEKPIKSVSTWKEIHIALNKDFCYKQSWILFLSFSLFLYKTRQSAQWGTYTPEERYRQFLTSTKYVALALEMVGWMNSMLIAISPKPLCRRIIKFNKRSWWYSYINLDAIFFLLLYEISKSVTLTWRSYPISTNMSNINEIPQRFLMV